MYIYAHVYVHVYVCMYVCIYVCMHIYIYICVCVCVYMRPEVRGGRGSVHPSRPSRSFWKGSVFFFLVSGCSVSEARGGGEYNVATKNPSRNFWIYVCSNLCGNLITTQITDYCFSQIAHQPLAPSARSLRPRSSRPHTLVSSWRTPVEYP
jgi:hypothetical protein